MDNYFSSPRLFQDLVQDFGTTATGTVRANRKGLPRPGVDLPLRNQEVVERRKGSLLCVAYQDGRRKPILLSTQAVAGYSNTTNRREEQVRRPNVVLLYNANMGGVDVGDAQLYKYVTERRTIKWTTKVAMSLFARAMLNAYLVYKENVVAAGNKPMTRHQFTIKCVESLTSRYQIPKTIRRRRSAQEIAADRADPQLPPVPHPAPADPWSILDGHDLVHLARGKRRNCVHHHVDTRVRTSYKCSGCDVGLCPSCFAAYHRNPVRYHS
jgi:hypothetical protein